MLGRAVVLLAARTREPHDAPPVQAPTGRLDLLRTAQSGHFTADHPDVSPRRWRVLVSSALLAVVGAGCGHGSHAPSRPVDALLARYADALARGDAAAAHALLTPDDRARLSPEAIASALRASPGEAVELSARLGRAAPARIQAIVVLDDGSEVRLEAGASGFAMVDPLTRFYAQSSPREALLSFVRAIERERWDVLADLLPNDVKKGLDPALLQARLAAQREELTRIAALLASAREAPIEEVGEHATMAYGESFTARLVREEGAWKVDDPD